jgi:hypothetical protein
MSVYGSHIDLLEEFERDLKSQAEFEGVRATFEIKMDTQPIGSKEDVSAVVLWKLDVDSSIENAEELVRKVSKFTDDWREAHRLPRRLQAMY